MSKFFIKADKNNQIGIIEKTVFGSFVEHLGRSVYNGIYQPSHPTADEKGFRGDVMQAVSEMGVSIVRYPGGNFVSGYDWKKAIGPVEQRPEVIDLAWIAVEPNKVGVDEFLHFADKVGAETVMAVNLGTGNMNDVSDLVQYCNLQNQGMWAQKRITNGHKQPYNVRYWCLGNEMDGSWQVCSKSAEDYSKSAVDAAKIIKWISPEAKTVACGSNSPFSPTFPAWDKEVLHRTFDYIDYISMHAYYTYPTSDHSLQEFLASGRSFEDYIARGKKLIIDEKRRRRSDKAVYLSVDEWNVWHTFDGTSNRQADWACGLPLLENNYDMADALVFAEMLLTLVNNADYVKIGCLAQLVNVIAPILTQNDGGVLKQTTFYPFAYVAGHFAGTAALRTKSKLPMYKSKKYGKAKGVYHTVAYDEAAKTYHVAIVNVTDENLDIDITFDQPTNLSAASVLSAQDIHAKNTFDNPDNVVLTDVDPHSVWDGKRFVAGSYSVTFAKFTVK